MIPEKNKPALLEKAKDFIRKRFPKVDFGKLGPIGFSKKGYPSEIVSFDPRWGESKIFKEDGSGFLKSFERKKSSTIDPMAREFIAKENESIRYERQNLRDSEKQLNRQMTLLRKGTRPLKSCKS